MNIVSYSQTHTGLVRQLNEDAHLMLPEFGVWVVADGMGGHEVGNFASQLVVNTLYSVINDEPGGEVNTDFLIAALEAANQYLRIYSDQQLNGKIAGTTVVILLLKDNCFYWLWVGDSRGYLLRDKRLLQATRDHSQVADWVEQKLMSSYEAERHDCANIITRAIGVEDKLVVDVLSGECQPGDIFLLCTDGLNKEITDSEIQSYLQHQDMAEGGKAMLHSTLLAGARDNVTFISIKVKDIISIVEK